MNTSADLCNRYAALLKAGLSISEVELQLREFREQFSASDQPGTELQEIDGLISFGRELGIPLAQLLSDRGRQLESWNQQTRALESAFAAPKSTARLVAGLPLLSLVMAQIAGLDPWSAIVNNQLAQLAVALGSFLLVLGWLVMKKMTAAATPQPADPGKFLNLFAESLLSGLPTRECFERSCMQLGLTEASIDEGEIEQQVAEASRLIDYSSSSGSSLRDLLLAQAEIRRAESFARQREAIERLAIRLMIPLGLVVLPAFALIGVIPVTIGMLSS